MMDWLFQINSLVSYDPNVENLSPGRKETSKVSESQTGELNRGGFQRILFYF